MKGTLLTDRELLVWECIKRNRGYLRSFKNHTKFHGTYPRLDPNINCDYIRNLEKKIISKDKSIDKTKIESLYIFISSFIKLLIGKECYLDSFPVVPYKKDFFIFKNKGKFYLSLKPIKLSYSLEKNRMEMVVKDFLFKKEDIIQHLPKKITVSIDLSYNKNDIMQALEAEIDMWLGLHRYLGLRKERTPDYKILKRYLKLHDLRNKEPKLTFEKIANCVYPSTVIKNLESAIQQVKREYARAQELINGGYKKIK